MIAYHTLKDIYESFGYIFNDVGNFNLNIGAIRSNNSQSDKFDDLGFIAYKDDWQPKVFTFPMTTDPGKHWLLNPLNINGCIIMVPGQYLELYKLGLHKGREALEQIGRARYVRDNNRDNELDFRLYWNEDNIFFGNYKTNLHNASKFKLALNIGKYSAGCQVVHDNTDYLRILHLCRRAKSLYGNSFHYTLFEQRQINLLWEAF